MAPSPVWKAKAYVLGHCVKLVVQSVREQLWVLTRETTPSGFYLWANQELAVFLGRTLKGKCSQMKCEVLCSAHGCPLRRSYRFSVQRMPQCQAGLKQGPSGDVGSFSRAKNQVQCFPLCILCGQVTKGLTRRKSPLSLYVESTSSAVLRCLWVPWEEEHTGPHFVASQGNTGEAAVLQASLVLIIPV